MSFAKTKYAVLGLISVGAMGIALTIATLVTINNSDGLLRELKSDIDDLNQVRTASATESAISLPVLAPELLWPAGNQGERDIQRAALSLLQSSGQVVRTYQRVEVKTDDNTRSGNLRVEFAGPLSGLLAFLKTIEEMSPPLAISNLQIQAVSNSEQRENQTMLSTRMTLWGLRDGRENE